MILIREKGRGESRRRKGLEEKGWEWTWCID